jgi:hypothetical protein
MKLEFTSGLQTAVCMHIVAMCCSSIPLLFLLVADWKGSFNHWVQDWARLERDGLLIGLVCHD